MGETCERCGGSMTYQGRVKNATTAGNHGHHNRVFYCKPCDREVLRG